MSQPRRAQKHSLSVHDATGNTLTIADAYAFVILASSLARLKKRGATALLRSCPGAQHACKGRASKGYEDLIVNRHAKLTPYRRPKLTPLCVVEIRA